MTDPALKGFRCWTAQGVAETVYSDIGLLTENADALFLAAHSPIELEHRKGAELGLASSGEAKVLDALVGRIGDEEVVPSSVELRWRPGERQAALTWSLCTIGATGSVNSASSADRNAGRCW